MTNRTTPVGTVDEELVGREAATLIAVLPDVDRYIRSLNPNATIGIYCIQAATLIEQLRNRVERLTAFSDLYAGHKAHCRWITTGDPDLARCECGLLEQRRELRAALTGEHQLPRDRGYEA